MLNDRNEYEIWRKKTFDILSIFWLPNSQKRYIDRMLIGILGFEHFVFPMFVLGPVVYGMFMFFCFFRSANSWVKNHCDHNKYIAKMNMCIGQTNKQKNKLLLDIIFQLAISIFRYHSEITKLVPATKKH